MGRHKEDNIQDLCWQCKERIAMEFKGRCYTCQANNCLTCGSPLIKIKRILFEGVLASEADSICSNPNCFHYIDLKNCKQVWKVIK